MSRAGGGQILAGAVANRSGALASYSVANSAEDGATGRCGRGEEVRDGVSAKRMCTDESDVTMLDELTSALSSNVKTTRPTVSKASKFFVKCRYGVKAAMAIVLATAPCNWDVEKGILDCMWMRTIYGKAELSSICCPLKRYAKEIKACVDTNTSTCGGGVKSQPPIYSFCNTAVGYHMDQTYSVAKRADAQIQPVSSSRVSGTYHDVDTMEP